MLEVAAFVFQSIGASLSVFVTVTRFNQLTAYDGFQAFRELVKVVRHKLLTNQPRVETIENLRLASTSATQLLTTFCCVFIVVLRCYWYSIRGWGDTPDLLVTGFLIFHLVLGMVAIASAVNVCIYFYATETEE